MSMRTCVCVCACGVATEMHRDVDTDSERCGEDRADKRWVYLHSYIWFSSLCV